MGTAATQEMGRAILIEDGAAGMRSPDVPQPHRAVATARRQYELLACRPRHHVHGAAVSEQRVLSPACRQVAQDDALVTAGDSEEAVC